MKYIFAIILFSVQAFAIDLVTEKATGGDSLQTGSGVNSYALTPSGYHLAFHSDATDVISGITDNNMDPDVYIKDFELNTAKLISFAHNSETTAADAYSFLSGITNDGGVLFTSPATNLISGFTNAGSNNLYLYDWFTKTNSLVSSAAGSDVSGINASVYSAKISPDGRYIAYTTEATNAVGGFVVDTGERMLFIKEVLTGTVRLVSRAGNSASAASNGEAILFLKQSFSEDGNKLVYASQATNIIPGQVDSNANFDVFVYNFLDNTNTLISRSVSDANTTANLGAFGVTISGNGKVVVFSSFSSNLITGVDTAGRYNVFKKNLENGEVTLVSRSSANPLVAANGHSEYAFTNYDGSVVVFDSVATDLVIGINDTNGDKDIFAEYKGKISQVTVAANKTDSGNEPSNPDFNSNVDLDPTGRYVIYSNLSSNLTELTDSNNFYDIFVTDLLTHKTKLLSVNEAGQVGNGASGYYPAMAGFNIVFRSEASNFVGTDSNGVTDLFKIPLSYSARIYKRRQGLAVVKDSLGLVKLKIRPFGKFTGTIKKRFRDFNSDGITDVVFRAVKNGRLRRRAYHGVTFKRITRSS